MDIDKELFKAYIKEFFSKWYVWLSIVFGIIGSIALFYTPSLIVLILIVILLSFLGVIFSGYKVYQELFDIIPSEYRLAYLPPKKGLPKVQISQIGGSEYSFGFRVLSDYHLHRSNSKEEVFPTLAGQFNFKIKNIGYIPVDILSISGSINDPIENYTNAYTMSVDTALSTNQNPLNYPIPLEHEEERQIILYTIIRPDNLLTDAQLAVKLREIHQSDKKNFISVGVEYVDRSGNNNRATKKFHFSKESIQDIFIENLKSLDEKELLRLTGVD